MERFSGLESDLYKFQVTFLHPLKSPAANMCYGFHNSVHYHMYITGTQTYCTAEGNERGAK